MATLLSDTLQPEELNFLQYRLCKENDSIASAYGSLAAFRSSQHQHANTNICCFSYNQFLTTAIATVGVQTNNWTVRVYSRTVSFNDQASWTSALLFILMQLGDADIKHTPSSDPLISFYPGSSSIPGMISRVPTRMTFFQPKTPTSDISASGSDISGLFPSLPSRSRRLWDHNGTSSSTSSPMSICSRPCCTSFSSPSIETSESSEFNDNRNISPFSTASSDATLVGYDLNSVWLNSPPPPPSPPNQILSPNTNRTEFRSPFPPTQRLFGPSISPPIQAPCGFGAPFGTPLPNAWQPVARFPFANQDAMGLPPSQSKSADLFNTRNAPLFTSTIRRPSLFDGESSPIPRILMPGSDLDSHADRIRQDIASNFESGW